MFRAAQPNFSRGVLAPHLHGRFDVDAYAAGIKEGTNVIILKYGGLTKRPGTRLVAEVVNGSEPTRIIPFQFSLTQTYALEMGQGYMSPCAIGGRLVEEELKITAITNEYPARISAAYHGYAEDELVYLTGINAGSMGNYLNGRFWRVADVISPGVFSIVADTTGLDPFVSCEGGTVRPGPPVAPPDPPVVPPVVPPEPPPGVGGGGGGGFGWPRNGNNPIP